MSELILVRHGQASFGTDSYDRLSAQGHRQVEILAAHWRASGQTFDHLYSGNLRRQQETAAILLPLVAPEGTEARLHEALNEYDGTPLISSYLREHGAQDGFEVPAGESITDRRLFQQVFEAAAGRWITDGLTPTADDVGFEAWPAFQARVHAVMDELMDRHRSGSRVLVSTSGGVIALMVQRALRMPDAKTIATNWMINNSGVTRIRYSGDRLSLVQFNSLAHLETPEYQDLISYR